MSEKIADVIKETENNKADRQEQYFFRTDQLTVGYDGKPLIREINIQLKKGEILTLIGPNGAGKSTILKSITRQLATISGTVYLDKEKMAKMTNKEVSQKLAVVLTERMRPELMTCEDIVATGRYPYTGTLGILSAEDKTKVKKSMETVHAWDLKDRDFTAISDGQRQRILLARAICQEPEIIVLDEPTSSLSNEEVEQLFEIIENLRKKKVSIIYISHRMEELFRISDRVTVIRDGAYVGTKKTSETSPNELVAMMVGRDLESFYARDYCDMDKAETALEVRNLSQTGVFEDISFSVHKGEILGFSGLVGAGRSEIMEAIFGATRLTSGEVILGGKPVHFKNPMQAIKAGIALVPEDRKKQGLVLGNSVAFNLTLSSLRFYMNGIAISERKRGEVIDHYSQRLRIKAASPEIEAGSLSGGNQQKVVLGKWLATKPDVLILDEPTRGVDVNAKFEIYTVINELAKEGIAIIMVSSELPEIINMCDNVCVVRAGRLVKKLSKDELSQEEIMKYAAGGIE